MFYLSSISLPFLSIHTFTRKINYRYPKTKCPCPLFSRQSCLDKAYRKHWANLQFPSVGSDLLLEIQKCLRKLPNWNRDNELTIPKPHQNCFCTNHALLDASQMYFCTSRKE